MAEITNISWSDATSNFWWGCSPVGPGCLHCYAETLNNNPRFGGTMQWGPGAPRRKIKGATAMIRKLNRQSSKFQEKHGRRMNVFMQSMSDSFDNEVNDAWRLEEFEEAEAADGLNIQLLTKRGPNVASMVPEHWKTSWPKHIGLMFTVVNQPEFNRDVHRLRRLKREFNIPWVGLSIEPMLEGMDMLYPEGLYPNGVPLCCDGRDCGCMGLPTEPHMLHDIDWAIVGCESGAKARPFDLDWARSARDDCLSADTAFFLKQIPGRGSRPITDISAFPADLQIQQFPKALQ